MGEAKRRREHCAYCGAPKVSDDHVPPKNLFPADRTDLITVPACQTHNGDLSDLDESFRNYVATRVGTETPHTQALLEKTLRGISRNKKEQIWMPDLKTWAVPIENYSFKPMVERITRGLYWHVYHGQLLPLDTEMQIGQMRIGEWLPEFVSDMARFRVGGDQFFYACQRMDEHPTVSVWVYVFHRRLVAMALTDLATQRKIIEEHGGKPETYELLPS